MAEKRNLATISTMEWQFVAGTGMKEMSVTFSNYRGRGERKEGGGGGRRLTCSLGDSFPFPGAGIRGGFVGGTPWLRSVGGAMGVAPAGVKRSDVGKELQWRGSLWKPG